MEAKATDGQTYLAFCVAGLVIVLIGGCGGDDWKQPATAPAAAPAAPLAPQLTAAQQAPASTPVPVAAGPLRSKAEVGVGAKGRNYGMGPVATPIAAYFRTKERLAFDIQIPHAMQLYKAMHDNQGPKTHEQFMKEIIQENQIRLPDLRKGDRYLYDPAKEELMVETSN